MFDGEINDVRFTGDAMAMSTGAASRVADPPSGPPQEFYFRVALGVTKRPCTAASKMMIFAPGYDFDRWTRYEARPHTVMWWVSRAPASGGRLIPHPRTDSSAGTPRFRTMSLSKAPQFCGCPWFVRWWAPIHFLSSHRIAGAYYHSHRGRFAGHLLVKGNHTPHSLAGLDGRRCSRQARQTAPPVQQGLPFGCGSVVDARARILEAATTSGELLCHDDPSAPTFVTLPTDPKLGTGGSYDRPSRAVCRAHRFAPGETWTSFSFSRALFAKKVAPFLRNRRGVPTHRTMP